MNVLIEHLESNLIPLEYAISYNQYKIVQYLLKHTSSIDVVSTIDVAKLRLWAPSYISTQMDSLLEFYQKKKLKKDQKERIIWNKQDNLLNHSKSIHDIITHCTEQYNQMKQANLKRLTLMKQLNSQVLKSKFLHQKTNQNKNSKKKFITSTI